MDVVARLLLAAVVCWTTLDAEGILLGKCETRVDTLSFAGIIRGELSCGIVQST